MLTLYFGKGFASNEDWEKRLLGDLHQSEEHHWRLKKLVNYHSRHAGWFTFCSSLIKDTWWKSAANKIHLLVTDFYLGMLFFEQMRCLAA